MPAPVCPHHPGKPMRRGPKNFYCPTPIGKKFDEFGEPVLKDDGSQANEFCPYKVAFAAAASPAQAGRAMPSVPSNQPTSQAAPRLEAAKVALLAAAQVLQGSAKSPYEVIAMADELYAGFLRPIFLGLPAKRKEPEPEPEETEYKEGPDDDIPF